MYPASFEYLAPGSVEDAVQALREGGPGARPLAGGQSLIPLMRLRLARPALLVDLRRLPISGVAERDGVLALGATTTHAELERSRAIAEGYPLLADVARVIGDPLVRNLGTVGGSAAHADPSGDWGPALLAAGAEMVAVGPAGERRIPADEFFTGSFETALGPADLLVEILLPRTPGAGGAYRKVRRKVGDFATVGVAAQLRLDARGRILEAGLGMTGVGLTYVRAVKAEEYLRGRRLDESSVRGASEIAREEAHPVSDGRGPAEYKRDLVRVLAARALAAAGRRAAAGR